MANNVPGLPALDPDFKGLNRDSLHPNPWRPPTDYTRILPHYFPHRIYKGFPQKVEKGFNWFRDESFGWKTFVAFKKGAVLGGTWGIYDALTLSKDQTPRAIIARVIYNAAPIAAMSTSYIAAREVFSDVFSRNGLNSENKWTYCLATVAPASIYKAWRNSMAGAARIMFFGSLISTTYVYVTEHANFFPITRNSWTRETTFFNHADASEPNLSRFSAQYDKEGPTWKKWLNKEE